MLQGRTRSRRGGFVRSGAECWDWMLVLVRRHLERVLRIYAAHYNEARPHRGLELRTPSPRADPTRRPADGFAFEDMMCWVGSSVSTNSLLEVGSGVCVPFREPSWRATRPSRLAS